MENCEQSREAGGQYIENSKQCRITAGHCRKKESCGYPEENEKEKEGAAESQKACTTESLEDSGSLAQTNLRHIQV